VTAYQHERREQRERPVSPTGRFLPREAPDLRARQDAYLDRRGLDPHTARFNGWYPSRSAGDSAARIVIPAAPASLGFWQARALDPKEPKRYQSPHGSRGDAVIVVYSLRPMVKRLVVCEGPMDALAATTTGSTGIALMGNTPPGVCFDYIASKWPRAETLVVPDRDAQASGAQWLAELTAREMRARLVILPAKDLASLSAPARTEALR
jgi:hypothetical protein